MCVYNKKLYLKSLIGLSAVIAFSVRGLALTAEEIGYEPHNKATATVSVSLQSVNGENEYTYAVHNLPGSQRAIVSFKIQVDVPVSSLTVTNPSSWDSFDCCIQDKHRVNATNIKIGGWLYGNETSQIQPGASLSGFKLRARGVPEIKRFFIESQSSTVVPNAEPGNQAESDALDELTDFFNDSTSGFTIGPGPAPISTDIGTLIDSLIASKHMSASLGWLGKAKFVAKLDKRLDQAKVALTRDKKKLARTHLVQFVHDLTKAHKRHDHDHEHDDKDDDRHGKGKDDHRRKKFVNDEAFQLLKINAEFIIAKLPAKAKDKDEEDECRRAEGGKDDDHDDGGKKDKGRDGGKEHDR
jgi:hypothetical protein